MGALFTCVFHPYGEGKWRAVSTEFPGLEGFGRTSEEARGSLAALVLNFYHAARERGLMVEP